MLMLQRNLMNSTVLPTPIVSQYPRRHQQKRESAASGPLGVSPDKATGHGSAGMGPALATKIKMPCQRPASCIGRLGRWLALTPAKLA